MGADTSFSQVQSSAQQGVTQVSEQMNNFMETLLEYAETPFDRSTVFVSAPWVNASASSGIAPAISFSTEFAGTDPGAAPSTSVSSPGITNAPSFDVSRPSILLPEPPSSERPAVPGNAPDVHFRDIPDARAITLPDVPVLQALVIPDAPPATLIPLYEDVIVDGDLLRPTHEFEYNEPPYDSELLTRLRAKLADDLANGGYGIEVMDELALWERARERELRNAEAQILEASRQAAARGFMMPPGALNAQIAKAQQTALEKGSEISRDIMVKRADMYVENRKFVIDQVRQLEDMAWKYWSFAQERALNAAKYSVEFAINIYNALVSKYNADVQLANVNATVYAAKLRAALAHIEEYKTRVEAVGVAAAAQKSTVDLYEAQVNAAMVTAQLYKTELEAVQVVSEIERIKLEAFKLRVDAYSAEVGARVSEAQVYRALVDGEKTKVDIYAADATVYAEKVRAYSAQVQAQEIATRTQLASLEASIDVYKAKIDRYRADADVFGSKVRAEADKAGVQMKRYEIQADTNVKSAQLSVEAQKANANIAIAAAQVESSHIIGEANALIAHSNMATGAAAAGLKVFGDIGAAFAGAASGVAALIKPE